MSNEWYVCIFGISLVPMIIEANRGAIGMELTRSKIFFFNMILKLFQNFEMQSIEN